MRTISMRRMATPVSVAPDKCDANFFVFVLDCPEEGTNVHLPWQMEVWFLQPGKGASAPSTRWTAVPSTTTGSSNSS